VALDQPPEAGRAGDVRPLADHHEVRVLRDRERLEAAEARDMRPLRYDPRRDAVDDGCDRTDMVGRRPATAADDVDEALACELAEEPARVVRLLVVEAELVRQAGVRVARDPRRR